MGLGLFLARTFAEQLNGRLSLDSGPPGGTRAELVWPELGHA
jgi:signal transduction histidine kinase